MKCERCNVGTKGYELHNYCLLCGKNLCVACMEAGTCHEASKQLSEPRRHKPAPTEDE